MEVKIGVTHANRELTLESSQSADEVYKTLRDALTSDDGLLVLHDDKGRTVYVPAAKVAYLEMSGQTSRRLGFAGGN